MKDSPMTPQEFQMALAESWKAQMEINESASIIKKIEDGQNPWG